MFWDKGYAPSQNIEALLEKENATVEEFLDDEDILQECKTQNKKILVNYFTRPDVIKRLVELITTEPSEELPMAQRFRHANMACEILTLGLPSLDEKILSDAETLKSLYSYLEKEPPLNPLLSSFFSKTFSMLFTKKSEQDWFLYQQMCLQLLEYIKSQHNFLDLVCSHFSTPVIPDLIMQMMKDVEGGSLKRNLYEWLTKDKLVERLIDILDSAEATDKHANVAEFFCDLIQQGRTMRQNEFENDSFEPAFNGSNPILKVIESEATVDALMNVILKPNAQESAIISGISVVLTLIKPVVFADEPNSDRLKIIQNRERDTHERILETVIGVIAPRLKEFNELLRKPPIKPEIITTSGKLTPPFGMVRLQICRLFALLLHTRNEQVSNAICETDFFENLLFLFKQYCWNNFLHGEVEKCLQLVFYTNLSNNSPQGSTIVNDGSFNKNNSGDNNLSILIFGGDIPGNSDESCKPDITAPESGKENINNYNENSANGGADEGNDANEAKTNNEEPNQINAESGSEAGSSCEEMQERTENYAKAAEADPAGDKNNAGDTTAVPADTGPSLLQIHVITKCKIVSRLIDCWQHNREMQSAGKGRRLGYMGHLIKIFKHITTCISEFEHIGALILTNLSDAGELELWQSITNANDGELTQALATQSKMLANCNAHEAADYSQHLPKEFLNDNLTSDCNDDIHWTNFLEDESNDQQFLHDVFLALDREIKINNFDYLDEDDDDENATTGDPGSHSLLFKPSVSTSALNTFGVTSNPWDTLDPFNDLTAKSNDIIPTTTPWTTDFPSDNFADFDSHFSAFTSDLGESLSSVSLSRGEATATNGANNTASDAFRNRTEEYDNNANVEKTVSDFGNFNKFEDDENAKNEIVAAAAGPLMSRDCDDDYEDDDGIWTKPVGGDRDLRTVDVAKELNSYGAILKPPTLLSNGPSKPPATESSVQLNISSDITDVMLTNDAAAEVNSKFPTAAADKQKLEIALNAASAADSKITSTLSAVNNVEIAPAT